MSPPPPSQESDEDKSDYNLVVDEVSWAPAFSTSDLPESEAENQSGHRASVGFPVCVWGCPEGVGCLVPSLGDSWGQGKQGIPDSSGRHPLHSTSGETDPDTLRLSNGSGCEPWLTVWLGGRDSLFPGLSFPHLPSGGHRARPL